MVTTFPLGESQSVANFKVYKDALLFRAGDYPDKNISVTPEELKSMMLNSSDLNLNLEHETYGALDALAGHLGIIPKSSMYIDKDDPSVLRGNVVIPDWLDPNLKHKGVSVEIPFTKQHFTGAAITYTPRIEDAFAFSRELMAAFAKKDYSTQHGQRMHQMIHDMAASAGAICSPIGVSNGERVKANEFSAKHEVAGFQVIHDTTIDHGAFCDGVRSAMPGNVLYSERIEDEMGFMEDLQALFNKHKTTPEVKEPVAAAEFSGEAYEKIRQQVLASIEAEKQANFANENTARMSQYLAEGKFLPAQLENETALRAKSPDVYDALWSSRPRLAQFSSNVPVITGDQAAAAVTQTEAQARFAVEQDAINRQVRQFCASTGTIKKEANN